jgi:uncharacterized protein (UPF0335 family)
MLKPRGYDFEANKDNLPDLRGMRIGETDKIGRISISFGEKFLYRFPVLGFTEEAKGWESYIINNYVEDKLFFFRIRLTKEGNEPIERILAITGYPKKLYADLPGKGVKTVRKILSLQDLQRLSMGDFFALQKPDIRHGPGRRDVFVENHKRVSREPSSDPLENLQYTEIIDAIERFKQDLSRLEQEIVDLIADGEPDSVIRKETKCTSEIINNLRRRLREALQYFIEDDVDRIQGLPEAVDTINRKNTRTGL